MHKGVYGLHEIEEMNVQMNVDLPDLSIFLDVKPEIGLQRIKEQDREINRYDTKTLEFHEKVYQGYKKLVKLRALIPVEASRTDKKAIIEDIYQIINKRINERKD